MAVEQITGLLDQLHATGGEGYTTTGVKQLTWGGEQTGATHEERRMERFRAATSNSGLFEAAGLDLGVLIRPALVVDSLFLGLFVGFLASE